MTKWKCKVNYNCIWWLPQGLDQPNWEDLTQNTQLPSMTGLGCEWGWGAGAGTKGYSINQPFLESRSNGDFSLVLLVQRIFVWLVKKLQQSLAVKMVYYCSQWFCGRAWLGVFLWKMAMLSGAFPWKYGVQAGTAEGCDYLLYGISLHIQCASE